MPLNIHGKYFRVGDPLLTTVHSCRPPATGNIATRYSGATNPSPIPIAIHWLPPIRRTGQLAPPALALHRAGFAPALRHGGRARLTKPRLRHRFNLASVPLLATSSPSTVPSWVQPRDSPVARQPWLLTNFLLAVTFALTLFALPHVPMLFPEYCCNGLNSCVSPVGVWSELSAN
ncbi:hypothetical protein C8R46DRAFT_339212 [Mycena filopes]|nr:hypothetical protein C8R46DRAFT_339212 [Mycena filopes]